MPTTAAAGPGLDPDDNRRALELDRAGVFHSWSAQAELSPMVLAGGSGCRVWDYAGTEYLDFSSQLVNVNIGYQHPRVVAAIQEQAAQLVTVSPATANLARGEAAKRILEVAGEGFSRVFFTNGGADANENAIRMARLSTGRDTVLSQYRSYHGGTGAAIVATGDWRRIPNRYARGHRHFFGPFAYRSEFWSDGEEQECERALHHLERTIQAEGAGTIAAILIETIPGTAGIMPPPAGYLPGVREIADRYGIVLILDEVMAGFGRTGDWFAFHRYGVTPDLVTFAKGVNSGYVPAGGVLISPRIAERFDHDVYPGGLTYSGHPLAMAAIVATIDAMRDEGIVDNAARVGAEVIGPALHRLAEDHPSVGDVRGCGVFWAIELVADGDGAEPLDAATMAALKAELLGRGLLPFVTANRIHVVPPCVVTAQEAAEGIAIIDAALGALRL
ncbi:aspartate aminotransferase family protein [Mycetocola reblochoni]|uniref:Adenosylmethionine-8-amino-7-oxononanoate aminotransferase n=2 Tax=Mycetocola reblochoni TaxID=331618 RepID=A0A1R4ITU4_9MICO|nr:aspartate aminotransferase family protein [Mycetocola reblochoni]RLP71042.1 aspartate aminotransferase family protein [Mycetocola reblochoni]SJN23301.1 Adenosylmethionine-8-amino-7-oxononanoate aminotransferase [Mycetocola reblochoni REB411]